MTEFHQLGLTLDSRHYLEIAASLRFWHLEHPAIGDSSPSGDTQESRLLSTLEGWVRFAGRFQGEEASPDPTRLDDDELRLLLRSLSYASDALLAFRRQGRRVAVPQAFLDRANDLLVDVESRGLHAEGRSVYEIAQVLSAATSHLREGRRPVRIEADGRVFYASGERAMSFDPARVLRGRADTKSGRERTPDAMKAGRQDGD